MKKYVALIALLSIAGASFAQQAMKPEDMIKFRKAAMSFQAWNMGKIKTNLDGTFNKDQVIFAANAIAATANSGISALFVPGSEKDVGSQKTTAKIEFFQQSDKVKEVSMNYVKEANELAKVAASGDMAAVKAQFGKTGGTCKACHDDFKNKD